jgi:uncharacterized membrane protein
MNAQQESQFRRGEHHRQALNYANMSRIDRILSLVIGGALTATGIIRGGVRGKSMTLLGSGFILQGAVGFSPMYKAAGVNRAIAFNEYAIAVPHEQGIRVEKSITINAPRENVYTFWRSFDNLPRFMSHLESVTMTGGGLLSHWVARAPAGMTIAWDAEIINEIPNEVIGWRSTEGASVPNAGAVRFEDAPGGNGAQVHVKIEYMPPAGAVGAAFAALFGKEPNQQVEESLRQLKQLLETGELATGAGQQGNVDRPQGI